VKFGATTGVEEGTVTTDQPSATPGKNHRSALTDAAEAEAAAAEADAAAAEAEARAAAARARAIRSRAQAAKPVADLADTDQPHSAAVESTSDEPTAPTQPKPRQLPLKALALAAAVVLLCGFAAASGYLVWRHHGVTQEQQRTAEFNAAARQGVVNLMSVDFTKAQEGVKRLLDNSTGKFKDDLADTADALSQSVQQAKVVTTVTVDSTAVESMSADSGVVLVAATSEAVDTTTKERKPAQWRLSITLTRDGGQLKMSQVDFVS
jgi:Mce-associated membrane protein